MSKRLQKVPGFRTLTVAASRFSQWVNNHEKREVHGNMAVQHGGSLAVQENLPEKTNLFINADLIEEVFGSCSIL
jgi:hypothetical protein